MSDVIRLDDETPKKASRIWCNFIMWIGKVSVRVFEIGQKLYVSQKVSIGFFKIFEKLNFW